MTTRTFGRSLLFFFFFLFRDPSLLPTKHTHTHDPVWVTQ